MTITETSKLDVIAKYKELIKVSTDADSLYIKAKETLEQTQVDKENKWQQNIIKW